MTKRLSVVVIKEEKFFVARGVEIELVSQGSTVEEALENLKEAFELWVKHAEPAELDALKHTDSPIMTQVVA